MGKLTNLDWWLGRTSEQKARKKERRTRKDQATRSLRVQIRTYGPGETEPRPEPKPSPGYRGRVAPIIDSPPDRGIGFDFRRSSDPEHVIRINDRPSKGLAAKLKEYVPVAGVSYRQEAVSAFAQGRNRSLDLRREPSEKFPEAIAVHGSFVDLKGKERTEQLGYVPKDIAKEIPGDLPIGATIKVMFGACQGQDAGLRMDIWKPRGKRTPKK